MGVKKKSFGEVVEGAVEKKELPREEAPAAAASRKKARTVSVRFNKEELARLRRVLDTMGLDLSAGIRMIVYEWIRGRR